jgi:toxin FitB
MYLLDTNITAKSWRGSKEAENWIRSVDTSALCLSVISLGEIERGCILLKDKDPIRSAKIAGWLQVVRASYGERIIAVTDQVALEWGRLSATEKRGDVDELIAATALVHGLILVTRNVTDFAKIGVTMVNPWGLST